MSRTWCSFTNINFGMSLNPAIRFNVRFMLQLLTSKYLFLDRVKNHFFCWLSHLLHFYLKSFILRFFIENSRINSFFIIYVPCMTLHYWHKSNTSIYLRNLPKVSNLVTTLPFFTNFAIDIWYNSNSLIKSKKLPPMLIFALMHGL